MDPISIACVVIGVVIATVEACRYVKHKFFHHKEARHEAGIIIKADELTMNGADLLRLQHNEDHKDKFLLDKSLAERGGVDGHIVDQRHDLHGKKVKITITSHSSSMDYFSKEREERGNSKVAEKLAGTLRPNLLPTPVSEVLSDSLHENGRLSLNISSLLADPVVDNRDNNIMHNEAAIYGDNPCGVEVWL